MRLRDVHIGEGVQLPGHIKNSKSIISFTHSKTHGHEFADNLCFFRCLALHFEASIRGLEGPANRLKERLEEYTGKSFDNGVEVSMLSIVEILFNIAINVYSLQEDKMVKVIRISNLNYKEEDIMHLNLYEHHFSYIKEGKFKSYAKKFQCPTCSRILNKACNLQNCQIYPISNIF